MASSSASDGAMVTGAGVVETRPRLGVVFVTVGTHQQPFDRLIGALEAVSCDELVVQYGHARPPRGATRATPFMAFPEVLSLFARADAVVTHAGVGSILCAANAGHVPVVVPRLRRHGEHVDDHQVELIQELERTGDVIVVSDVSELATALLRVPPRRTPVERRMGPLHESVRAAMLADAPTRLRNAAAPGSWRRLRSR